MKMQRRGSRPRSPMAALASKRRRPPRAKRLGERAGPRSAPQGRPPSAATPSIRRRRRCSRKFWTSTAFPAKVEPPELLTIGGILHLPGSGAQIICLSYVGADIGAPRVRYAIRRLRRRLPEAKIIAGFWRADPDGARELVRPDKGRSLPDPARRGGGVLRRRRRMRRSPRSAAPEPLARSGSRRAAAAAAARRRLTAPLDTFSPAGRPPPLPDR